MKTNLQHQLRQVHTLACLTLAILPILLPFRMQAQWNTNTSVNILISGLPTADIQSVATTDGKTWIAFYHQNTGNYDMRAQLIDANGYKLLGADGMLVSNQPSGSATFVFNVCVDGSNNLIIGCQDQRSGPMQSVVYKISQSGTQLWGASGIVLGGGLAPYPVTLSNGEVAVVWNGDAGNTLNLQKITTSGTLAWGTPIQIVVGTSTTTRGQIIANTTGKFTMVYQKGSMYTTLYAQMFDNNGTALYSPLQICNQTTAAYRYYSIVAESDTTYYGYYSSVGNRFNSFLQRINPTGTIPWGMNGSNFNTSVGTYDNYQTTTNINMTPGSGYVWSVCTFCDYNQTIYGIYMQKFLKTTGARQFTDLGKAIYPVNSNANEQRGDLALVYDTPLFLMYDVNYKIYATRLDANGNFIWTGDRVELSSTTATGSNAKMRFGFTPDGPNRCAGVWTENRGSGYMGYAQGVSIGGLIGLMVATQGSVPATITTLGGTLQMIATVYPASANQTVTWDIVPVTGQASINSSGLVTAIANGTVYAKATAVQDVTVKDSLLITISGQIPLPPLVTTLAATNITGNEATLNGSVNANNLSTTVTFNWGLNTGYGNTATATPSTVTGATATAVYANITGLNPVTTYHFRCVGVNSVGTTYGADMTFTTCQPPAAAGTITGPSTVCQNQTGVIYAVPTIANATSYTWTLPAGASITAGSGTNSITVSFSSGAVSGNVTVAGTNSCTSGPSSTKAVTVNPAPVPTITGAASTCIGSTNYTYSTETGMTNYTWIISSGGTIVSGTGTSSVQVHWAATGAQTLSITYSNANGCLPESPTILNITVYQLPSAAGTINGPSTVCAGAQGNIYYVDVIPEAVNYNWSLPSGATIVAGSGTNIITVNFAFNAVSGTISVVGNNACGDGPGSSLSVIVNPAPDTPSITANGYLLTSSASSGNQWYKDGNSIGGANAQTYTVQATGTYWTIVTLSGCESDSSNKLYIVWVGIDEKNAGNVEICPVPNDGRFSITISSETTVLYKLEVFNNLGIKIYGGQTITINSSKVTPVDLGNVPAGVYTIVLRNADNRVVRKILVNR
ncbi:MAG: T9SS type A sorting domain-containing protein [Bacteroidetes bacterium]|nr:T9SS type A sorting domain-containing protein [Bacteroidota bacterium]